MEYEYLALTWATDRSGLDPVFGDDMREFLDERWEEVFRASFEPSRIGGACIMRRPKDEVEERATDFEYVAVSMRDFEHCAVKTMLAKEDWEEHLRVPWHAGHLAKEGCVIMRRPKDEPRMWTEGEIERIAKNVLGQSGWTPPRPATKWGDMSGSGKEETNG